MLFLAFLPPDLWADIPNFHCRSLVSGTHKISDLKPYIAGISDTFCLCYYFLCVLYMLAYVWCNEHVNSCLHIDFFIECRPHIHQPIHCTQKVGPFVEQISDFSCVEAVVWVLCDFWNENIFTGKCSITNYLHDLIFKWRSTFVRVSENIAFITQRKSSLHLWRTSISASLACFIIVTYIIIHICKTNNKISKA